MTEKDLKFIETVQLPEYEGYGWLGATKIVRDLIAEIRKLNKKVAKIARGDVECV